MKKGKLRVEKKANTKDKSTKLERFIKTSDDWYPNYEGNKVKLIIFNNKFAKQNTCYKDFVRIAVWGNDDFAMELDFEGSNEAENDAKFREWKESIYDKVPEPCTKEYFRQLGFVII